MTSEGGDSKRKLSPAKSGVKWQKPEGTRLSNGRKKLGSPSRGKSSSGASRKSRRRSWLPKRPKGNGSCRPT
eukprot:8763435-Heterocapsa_arctica.AAC.1